MEAVSDSSNMSMIGQFGLEFYSASAVSNKVRVLSNVDGQCI